MIARPDPVDHRNIMGKGLGYVDIHLLAATLLTGASLWTHDKKLEKAAAQRT